MFIEVNRTFQDKREHERRILLLKRLLQYEFSEISRRYGFTKKDSCFIHDETGLRVHLVFEEAEQKPL